MRRLNISLKREPALHAKRVLIGSQKLVYILVAEKRHHYPFGGSRIVYIGTTKSGSSRVAQSVATRADAILQQYGIRSFEARIVTCGPRRRVRTWVKLERALLLVFREIFGSVPMCNTRGQYAKAGDEAAYFRRERLAKLLQDLS